MESSKVDFDRGGSLMLKFLRLLFGNIAVAPEVTTMTPAPQAVNEGDVHSGPNGYSPNTEYIETQYGSRFDEESEWNE